MSQDIAKMRQEIERSCNLEANIKIKHILPNLARYSMMKQDEAR